MTCEEFEAISRAKNVADTDEPTRKIMVVHFMECEVCRNFVLALDRDNPRTPEEIEEIDKIVDQDTTKWKSEGTTP